jgi:hypothetical protein
MQEGMAINKINGGMMRARAWGVFCAVARRWTEVVPDTDIQIVSNEGATRPR